ncbi:MAG TPA: DinB family protein [Ktedonobacterales bacterium]
MSTTGDALRDELLTLLTPGNAHMTFEDAVAIFPMAQINTVFPNGTYTPWHLLEHLRITQWDILDFIRNSNYQEIEWPKDYWPPQDQQATPEDWDRTLAAFQADLRALQDLVRDPATDLMAKIPHGTGQTFLREILTVADHNAYHIGEFAIMRQAMGTWGGEH